MILLNDCSPRHHNQTILKKKKKNKLQRGKPNTQIIEPIDL